MKNQEPKTENQVPNTLNEWLLSLPKEHRDLLHDDKWLLAEQAFRAGFEAGKNQ